MRQSAAIGDADTADFLTEIWPGVDDRLWFVESRAASI
jgi:DNA-binding ferritin-like protein